MEQTRIRLVLDYIETHLTEELDNKILAQISGYSEYHFIRLFRKYVYLTPADYIRKRRISEIVCSAGEQKRPMSEIAFAFGFNSKENFTRAFKNEHHILPTEWKASGCSLRLYMPFSFEQNKQTPTVSLQYLEEFSLTVYPFDDAFPPHCWNRYNAEQMSLALSGGKTAEDFGAMIWDNEKQCLLYHIGIKTPYVVGRAENTVQLLIGGGLYAVFETPPAEPYSFVDTIRNTWDWIYRVWFPASSYCRADGYELESYVETSMKYTERIYIPIRKE